MKKARTILFCLIGAAAIILSVVVLTKDAGSWMRSEAYGVDAYTGIQNAAARTANNVQALAEITRLGLGAILLVGGAALVVCGITCGGKEPAPADRVIGYGNSGAYAKPAPAANTSGQTNHGVSVKPVPAANTSNDPIKARCSSLKGFDTGLSAYLQQQLNAGAVSVQQATALFDEYAANKENNPFIHP